ncbi:hypothetical protein [Oceanisphaera sp. W20_SRM_FM3]|uniref:hypothetical protein n=1 Tax=Oceanisphaera sp. W20_SRM_FM3 TaxID=3240267 RepID=UPI003F9D73BF
MKTHMKSLVSLAFSAMFALMLIPAQSNTVLTDSAVVIQTLSAGDGVDNRQCRMLEKQDKPLPGFCGP